MSRDFGNIFRKLRIQKGLSQLQIAQILFVDRSTISSWETGRRTPDTLMISRICECLEVDMSVLLGKQSDQDDKPVVIMVDDEKIILSGNMPVLERSIPEATIVGFTRPAEAKEFARNNHVSLAFVDIELGRQSGLDLCRSLLEIDPLINVVFLTAYMDYSFDAWETGASGFLIKPLPEDAVARQLTRLRHPLNIFPEEIHSYE